MRLAAALSGTLRETLAREMRAGERAVAQTMDAVARGVKEDLRAAVRQGGLGEKLARAWRSDRYPKGQPSLSAAAVVTSKAPTLHRVFSEGATIRSADGFFLAIPTEAAPKRGVGGKRITPSTFPEARFGRLRFVYRRNGPSLLVVDGVRINRSGRVGRQAKGGGLTKRGAFKKGITTVVMFTLIPQARLRRRYDLDRVARRWAGRIPDLIVAAWEDADARR